VPDEEIRLVNGCGIGNIECKGRLKIIHPRILRYGSFLLKIRCRQAAGEQKTKSNKQYVDDAHEKLKIK